MPKWRAVECVLCLAVLLATGAGRVALAAGGVDDCEKAKLTAAGKSIAGGLRCHAKAAATGVAVDPACLATARSKLGRSFDRAEAKGPCPFTDEVATITALSDALVPAVGAALAPSNAVSRCGQQKLLAAAKRAQNGLKAEARHATSPERERLGASLAKVDATYAAAFATAEGEGDCLAVGGAAVAAQLDATAAAVVDGIRGTLGGLAAARGRLLGASIRADVLTTEAAYRDTAARQFNFVTTWGETVWANVEPAQGVFNLGPLDALTTFAAEHGMAVKGITLVWDQFVPPWLAVLDPPDFEAAVANHIATLVGGYAGRIHIWDVVNEALLVEGLRPTPFLDKLGPGYIAQMFQLAHQADPMALLFYNEFGAASPGPLADAVYALMQDLLQQGVPVHGVGLQVHAALGAGFTSRAAFQANLQRFADLGLRVQVAEMDVAGGDEPRLNAAQRVVYHDAVAACMAVAGCDVAIFGFTDKYIWVGQRPLIFDLEYRPKAAFFGVRDALLGH